LSCSEISGTKAVSLAAEERMIGIWDYGRERGPLQWISLRQQCRL